MVLATASVFYESYAAAMAAATADVCVLRAVRAPVATPDTDSVRVWSQMTYGFNGVGIGPR